MADTRDFDVVRIGRSDGADTGPGYWPYQPSSAVPTAAAAATAVKKAVSKDAVPAEKIPRTKPQMVRLDENDPRFIEWKVKLGILLKQELSLKPDEGNAWYVQFPRGYWLYEKSKHLWVSGYPIKAKLFKTPQEFGLHLIWLLSSSQSYADCSCVHCNAPNPATISRMGSVMEDTLIITPSEKAPKVTPVPLPPIPGQQATKAARSPMKQAAQPGLEASPQGSPNAAGPAKPQPRAKPKTQLQAQATPVQVPNPSPVAQVENVFIEPLPINLQSPFLFRVGELVWFQTGTTWRLGIIASQFSGSNEIVQLGHGSTSMSNVPKRDSEMRPFHAFSVPPAAVAELVDKSYDDVPFDALFQQAGESNKRDLLNLDASKLAATKIDQSQSLWSVKPPATGPILSYQGLFLGAERIELGDCVRIDQSQIAAAGNIDFTPNTGLFGIMAIQQIFTHHAAYPGVVFFKGPAYAPLPPGSSTPPLPDDQLPAALRDEIQWKRQVNPVQAPSYAVINPELTIEAGIIKGRFYPVHRLMPILDSTRFEAAVAKRQVDNLHPHFNNRPRPVVTRSNRLLTFGTSVPLSARLNLEGFIKEGEEGVFDESVLDGSLA